MKLEYFEYKEYIVEDKVTIISVGLVPQSYE